MKMKNILLLLILTFSLTSIAQSKYTIEKQLQLNTVYRGDPEDSILVRSPDRIVKMISRNELGTGAGTLQSVINANSTASKDGGSSSVSLLAGSEDSRYSIITNGDGSRTSNFMILNEQTSLSNRNANENKSGAFEIFNGYTALKQSDSLNSSLGPVTTIVKFDNPKANTYLNFPAKPNGTYTIATLDDIEESGSGTANLDATLKTGSSASISTNLLITAPDFNFSTNNSRGSIYSSNRGVNIAGQNQGVYIDGHAGGIHLGNTSLIDFNSPTEFLQETRLKNNFIIGDSHNLVFQGTGNTGVITKSGLGPLGLYCSGGINMQGPSIKVNNQNLIIAVNGAVATDNGNIVTLANDTTTIALSNSALNSSYPQATPGFKVYCYQIFPNKTIYEKTTEGWIQYSFSAVNP
jgi:hypothetical protein